MISYRKQTPVWKNMTHRKAGIRSQDCTIVFPGRGCAPARCRKWSCICWADTVLQLLQFCLQPEREIKKIGREIKENWGITMVYWQWSVTLLMRKWKYTIGSNNTNLELPEISSDSNLLTSWDSLLLRVWAASSWPSKEHTWACLVWSSWLRRSLLFTAALASSWTIWSSLCTDWSSTRTSSF